MDSGTGIATLTASVDPNNKRHICCPAEDARHVPTRDLRICSKQARRYQSYSINSSARVSTDAGTAIPSALAVLINSSALAALACTPRASRQ